MAGAKFCNLLKDIEGHMTADYRRRLAYNIRALLSHQGIAADRLQARYMAGAKKGKLVSARTIAYILADRDDKYGANLDALAAIACSLGVDVYQLLVPDLDLHSPITPQQAESYIENEVERRFRAAINRAIARHDKLQAQAQRHETAEDIARSEQRAAIPRPLTATVRNSSKAAPKKRSKEKAAESTAIPSD